MTKYILHKNDNEIDLYFHIRQFFIEKMKPNSKKKFELMKMYSNILINILFLKCRYYEKTEKPVKSFINKYKNELIKSFMISNF